MRMYLYLYLLTLIYACVYLYILVYSYISTLIYNNTYLYTYTHTHTPTHMYIGVTLSQPNAAWNKRYPTTSQYVVIYTIVYYIHIYTVYKVNTMRL